MKLWNYFGPSSKNLGMKSKDLEFPFNNKLFNPAGIDPNYLLTVSTEVGPYVPAIYP